MDRIKDTVCLSEDGTAVDIIDQTLLPQEVRRAALRTPEEVWDAIRRLRVRGAPAIGVSAAYGLYLAARAFETDDPEVFRNRLHEAAEYLNSARPTAVNLSWALQRMEKTAADLPDADCSELLAALRREADAIYEEDKRVCRRIGEYGLTLLSPGMGLLTHCNAGRLAAVQYGTATAPIYAGHEAGYDFHVFCDETRPLLQGIRLTAFELQEAGIDTVVICDNMAQSVMRKGLVQAVLVGCDRVAANGDVANKIGTAQVALAAKYYDIPFYVCCPSSTIDLKAPTGDAIPIEERSGEEITEMWYREPMGPPGIRTFNPSFDVTDAKNVTAIVTEYGIARPPYTASLQEIMKRKEAADDLS